MRCLYSEMTKFINYSPSSYRNIYHKSDVIYQNISTCIRMMFCTHVQYSHPLSIEYIYIHNDFLTKLPGCTNYINILKTNKCLAWVTYKEKTYKQMISPIYGCNYGKIYHRCYPPTKQEPSALWM